VTSVCKYKNQLTEPKTVHLLSNKFILSEMSTITIMRFKIAVLLTTVFITSASPAVAKSDYDSAYQQYAKSKNYWLGPCLNESIYTVGNSPCDYSSPRSDVWYQPATTDVTTDIGFNQSDRSCAKGNTKFFEIAGTGLGKGGIVSHLWSYGLDGDVIDQVVSEYWVKSSRNGSSTKWVKATNALKIFPLAPSDPCSFLTSIADKPPRLFGWPIPKTAGNYKVEIAWFSRARWRCSVYDPNGCSWNKSEFIPHFTINVNVSKNSVKIGKIICALPDRTKACVVSE